MARIPASLRQAVTEAARGRCAYCHSPQSLIGVSFEIDHVVPQSAGGRTTVDNLCLSCPTCNRHKANRISAPDPITRRSTRLFHPHQDHWPDHFGWSDDGSQIIGLTPTGRATVEALRFNRLAMLTLRLYWIASGVRLET